MFPPKSINSCRVLSVVILDEAFHAVCKRASFRLVRLQKPIRLSFSPDLSESFLLFRVHALLGPQASLKLLRLVVAALVACVHAARLRARGPEFTPASPSPPSLKSAFQRAGSYHEHVYEDKSTPFPVPAGLRRPHMTSVTGSAFEFVTVEALERKKWQEHLDRSFGKIAHFFPSAFLPLQLSVWCGDPFILLRKFSCLGRFKRTSNHGQWRQAFESSAHSVAPFYTPDLKLQRKKVTPFIFVPRTLIPYLCTHIPGCTRLQASTPPRALRSVLKRNALEAG